jgi:hypothetical protein
MPHDRNASLTRRIRRVTGKRNRVKQKLDRLLRLQARLEEQTSRLSARMTVIARHTPVPRYSREYRTINERFITIRRASQDCEERRNLLWFEHDRLQMRKLELERQRQAR